MTYDGVRADEWGFRMEMAKPVNSKFVGKGNRYQAAVWSGPYLVETLLDGTLHRKFFEDIYGDFPCCHAWKNLAQVFQVKLQQVLGIGELHWDSRNFRDIPYGYHGSQTVFIQSLGFLHNVNRHEKSPRRWPGYSKDKGGGGWIEYDIVASCNLDIANLDIVTRARVDARNIHSPNWWSYATNKLISRKLAPGLCLAENMVFASGMSLKELGVSGTSMIQADTLGALSVSFEALKQRLNGPGQRSRVFDLKKVYPTPNLESLLQLADGIFIALVLLNLKNFDTPQAHYITWDAWRGLIFIGGGRSRKRTPR